MLPRFLAEPPLSVMNTIFRILAAQPFVKYGGAALLAYMALVRFLRYKRINALIRKYPDPTIPFRNLDAAREVSSVVSELDFPFMYILSLEYALFKTYSIPSISKLLVATKEFKNNGFKRTDDTFLIGFEFLEVHGRNSRRAMMEGKVDERERLNDEQRADLAMERLNFIHGQYNIKQGDYLYTLSQIVLETPSFIGRFEWRPLQEIEKNAIFAHWLHHGRAMGIQNIPGSLEKLERWAMEYEIEHSVFAPTNRDLADITFGVMLSLVPSFLHPFARQVAYCLLTNRLRAAFGIAPPPPGLTAIVHGLLYARAAFIRYFMLPRQIPKTRTASRANKEGRYVPNYHKYKPVYPEGYRIDDLGPEKFIGRCPVSTSIQFLQPQHQSSLLHTTFNLDADANVASTRIALDSLKCGPMLDGAQRVNGKGTITIDKSWHPRVTEKLQSYGFPANASGHSGGDYLQVLRKYKSGDLMMSGAVSTDTMAACGAVASDTWAQGGSTSRWCGLLLSCSVADLFGGIGDALKKDDGSSIRELMQAAVPEREAPLIADIDHALATDGHTFCGCDADGMCGAHFMQTCINTRKDTVEQGIEFIRRATASSTITSIDMACVSSSSVLKTSPADAPIEGGTWYRFVQKSRIPRALWPRHFGCPVLLNTHANRWLLEDCPLVGARMTVGGYMSDCGAMQKRCSADGTAYGTRVAEDERVWKRSIGAAEICVSLQIIHTWNRLMDEISTLSRHANLPFVILEGLTAKQRSNILILDTCLAHHILQEDATALCFPDLATAQTINGYSDQAEDIMMHGYNNGLFMAFGAAGAVFDDEHPAIYGSLSRSLMAACQYRHFNPGSQACCQTAVWNILNGRHRSLEKAVYVKWQLLQERFDLSAILEKWKPIEKYMCTMLCGEAWVKEAMLSCEERPADGTANAHDLWACAIRHVADKNGCCVEALIKYFCMDCDCTPGTVCALHNGKPNGSDALGELALLMESTSYGEIPMLVGWILCGVAWFHRALHLRCGFLGYALILNGAQLDFTCA
ncbi:unnamed protein product [Mortierella alpina]